MKKIEERHSIEGVQGKSAELSQKTEFVQENLEHLKSKVDETGGLSCNIEPIGDQEGKLVIENVQSVQDDVDKGTTEQDDVYGSTTEIDDMYGSTTEQEDIFGSTTEQEDICRGTNEQDELYAGTTEVDDCTENEKEECSEEMKEVSSSAVERKALILFLYFSYQFIISVCFGFHLINCYTF